MFGFIKYKVYKLVSNLLNELGYHLVSHIQMKSLVDFSANILKAEQGNNEAINEIDSIIFSKDRAMQLHAFLASYIEMASNRGRIYILYTYSNERHKKSYEDLIELFSTQDFVFVKETQFRPQLIEIIEKSNAEKILFYVDDMIFTHKIDYNILKTIDTTSAILSISRGKDMDYSIVLEKKLSLPAFTKLSNNLEQFKWNYSDIYSDWTYPLGISGYMYGRTEIVSMFKAINFKAPNSLESGMQLFLPYFKNRDGLCTEFASCTCVHANLVQTEGKNPVLGTFSIDQLLDLWEKGKRIDLKEFYNKPMQITQIQKYTFI